MDINDILKNIPIDDIATKLGVSPDVAAQAVEQAGGALLTGLASNAQSKKGSASIQAALSKHEGFSGASSLNDIDEEDGKKIVQHVFGKNETAVAKTLSDSKETAGGIDFAKLLPILAPIVMGLIANGAKSKKESASEEDSGGGIGDIIGGLLGGGSSSGGGIDLGGMLGGLLGGGGKSSGGGIDLGGMLGGLLGGKK